MSPVPQVLVHSHPPCLTTHLTYLTTPPPPAGKNTHMAAHELSRLYRREDDVEAVQGLLAQAEGGTAEMKADLVETLTVWLGKRQR